MCDPQAIQWIYKIFGDCVLTSRDKISFTIGLISTCLSLIASLPQIITNFKSKSVEGISPIFPILLVFGDLFSFIGGFITGTLATQIITGIVYFICDTILLTQWIVYHFCYINGKPKKRNQNTDDLNDKQKISSPSNRRPSLSSDMDEEGNPRSINRHPSSSIKIHNDEDSEYSSSSQDYSSHAQKISGVLGLAVGVGSKVNYSEPYKGSNLIGSIFGWCSGLIYTSSRIPQLIKNFRNHKVLDLNPLYFFIMFVANLSYVISILVKSTDGQYLWKQTPFIIGALGPVFCDGITLIQAICFGISKSNTYYQSDNASSQSQSKESEKS